MGMTQEVNERLSKEIRKELIKTAIGSVRYVALGAVMGRDLISKHGISEADAEHLLAVQCRRLTEQLQALLTTD